MTFLQVRNATRNVVLGQKIRAAHSFVDRAVGLLLTASLKPGEGLWIHPCTSVHTFFMRFPIDVLFLDDKDVVLSRQTLAPWKLSGWNHKSRGVLELSAGTLDRTGTQVGDRIDFEDLPAGRQG
jgi:uncharacterized membrane protein (UPF0127 family)